MKIKPLLAINMRHLTVLLNHRFYRRLINGELTHEQLGLYLAQDNLYLAVVAFVLEQLAHTANNDAAAVRIFHKHRRDTMDPIAQQGVFVRKTLRLSSMLKQPPRPTTYAYANHLRVSAAQGLAEGVACLIPCYYFFRETVAKLKQARSKDLIFARWIDSLPTDQVNLSWTRELNGVFEAATRAQRSSRCLRESRLSREATKLAS